MAVRFDSVQGRGRGHVSLYALKQRFHAEMMRLDEMRMDLSFIESVGIDPEPRRAEFYRLREGAYEPVLPEAEGELYSSTLSGFFIRVEWLWNRPKLCEVYANLGFRRTGEARMAESCAGGQSSGPNYFP